MSRTPIAIDLTPPKRGFADAFPVILRGRTLPDEDGNSDDWSETFTCLPEMPIGILADLGDWSFPPWRCVAYIRGLLIPGDEERFDQLIHDKTRVVTEANLAQIVARLLTEISGFPTDEPSVSPNGAGTIGTTSTGDSSSPGTSPVRSPAGTA